MARSKKQGSDEEQDLLDEQSESSAPESSFSDESSIQSDVSGMDTNDSDVSHAGDEDSNAEMHADEPSGVGTIDTEEATAAPEAAPDDGLMVGEDPDVPPIDDNLQETEGLLRDVPAPLVVELTRLRMNTAQVIRLKKGQILRLPRTPRDPVNLVVNGKLFARAELVDVDGEIGVRLLELVGAH